MTSSQSLRLNYFLEEVSLFNEAQGISQSRRLLPLRSHCNVGSNSQLWHTALTTFNRNNKFYVVNSGIVVPPPLPQAASLEDGNKRKPCKRPIMTEVSDNPPKRKQPDFTSVTPTPLILTEKAPPILCSSSDTSDVLQHQIS